MPVSNDDPRPLPWLELTLAGSILALVVQLFPSTVFDLLMALDMRTWTPLSWFAAFAVFFGTLCVIRFGPEISDGIRGQLDRSHVERAKKRKTQEAADRRRKYEEERKLYQRMAEARKRRVM